MAKDCGDGKGCGPKSILVKRHSRSTPLPSCFGPGKPGPRTVRVEWYRRSKP